MLKSQNKSLKITLETKWRKTKKIERIQLLEQGLKVHNEAVANAEGKLTGDLSCYTITFINEMAEQAEQTGTVLDLDCGSSLINKEFTTIEEAIEEAKRSSAYTEFYSSATIEVTPEDIIC